MNERELTLLFKIRDMATAEIKKAGGAVEDLSKKSEKTRGLIKKLGSGLVSIGKTALSVATSFKALAAAVAAFLSIRAVLNVFTGVADELDRISKLSRELNITTESLSGLLGTIEQTGIATQDFTISLRKLNVVAGQARSGNSDLAKTFRDIGVSIGGVGSEKSTDQILFDMADRFSKMQSSSEKARLAAKLFGEDAGPKMLELLSLGSRGLKDLIAQSNRFGLVVGSESAKSAENFNDALARLKSSIHGIFVELSAANFQEIADFLNGFAQFIADNRETAVKFIQRLLDAIKEIAIVLGNVISGILSDIADGTFPQFFEAILNLTGLYIDRLIIKITSGIAKARNSVMLELAALPPGVKRFLGIEDFTAADATANTFQSSPLTDNSNAIREQLAELKKLGNTGFFSRLSEVGGSLFGGSNTKKNIDATNESLRETKNIMADLGKELSGGFSAGWKQVYDNVMNLSGAVSGVVTSAFSTLQGAATSAVEGMIDGSLKASDAMKQFGRAIITTLISVAAQLAVMIPLFLLFNVLSGGALSAAGAATTAASVGSVGGLVAGFLGTGGGSPSSGGQTLVNTAPGTTSNSAMSSPGGQTNVTIQAMDSKSFTEFLARPDNTKAVGNTVVASTRNAGVRRSLGAR